MGYARCLFKQHLDFVGANWHGQNHFANALMPRAPFQAFSLQDAVEYAEFIIDSTAKAQRFSRELPTVGGAIDIALITPFDDFTWIKRKELYPDKRDGKKDKK